MLGQATATQMQLVNFALNDRSFAAAQITTASNTTADRGWDGLAGFDGRFEPAGFHIDAQGKNERAHGKQAGSEHPQIGLRMRAQGSRQEADCNKHDQRPGCDHQVAWS